MGPFRRRITHHVGPNVWSEDPLTRVMQQIDWFLIMSGFVPQSRAQVPFERWARNLLADGIEYVPDLCAKRSWAFRDVQIANRVIEMIHNGAEANAKRQGDRFGEKWHRHQSHALRDLRAQTDPLARRPYKGTKPLHYVDGQVHFPD